MFHHSTNSQSGKCPVSRTKGLVLLCIAANKVQSEIRYEGIGSEELYPHIYGPLNVNAVMKVADFEPAKNGKFVLPKEIADTKTAFE